MLTRLYLTSRLAPASLLFLGSLGADDVRVTTRDPGAGDEYLARTIISQKCPGSLALCKCKMYKARDRRHSPSIKPGPAPQSRVSLTPGPGQQGGGFVIETSSDL